MMAAINHMRSVVKISLLVGALLSAMGCTADNYPLDRVPYFPAPMTGPPAMREYRIQAGDSLLIQSYYDKSLQQGVNVRPDGWISVILLGEIKAAGKTLAKLDQELRQAYWEQLPAHPDIVVSVIEIASQVVYVGGEVKSPELEPIKGSLTILQSVMSAGGFLMTANQDQLIILRDQGDGEFRAFQYNARLSLKNQGSELYLQPHDIVYVPKIRIAWIDQYVSQYVNQIIPDAIRFSFGYMFFNQQGNSSSAVHISPQ